MEAIRSIALQKIHTLIEIEPPLSGHISVQFLKAILNNATLYIRPLQCSICYDDMKQLSPLQVCSYNYCI